MATRPPHERQGSTALTVNRLGGAISVTSEIGQGTRFSFTLPLSVSDGSQTLQR